MTEIVAADIGGTHARLATAEVAGRVVSLGKTCTLRTAEHANLQTPRRPDAAA